ncbi:MAG: hypothetical protein ACREN8_07830 [Candidatus Dormibacteraceae bacterium]
MPRVRRKRSRELTLQVDLHGCDVLSAINLALCQVREARNSGYQAVELVHGAADVEYPVEVGRGRIKWELRRLIEEGGFDAWADPCRSWIRAGSITLYLWSGDSRWQ